ncbi:SprT family protein [Salibacterium salarium]|uniref:Protein SprT-like n=1 Tax=Salibacterium salarium TaxID=284579 RepID=A0A3R9P1W3_9BACI|nr:SprT family protein [Salibacterium salarium]RSL29152.1 SprT family protein [Salibacterium salarium]
MEEGELNKLTQEISMSYFAKPFLHKAVFNNRLRTTGGRYMLSTHNIEINPKQYEKFGQQELILILKHELCHYHLHLEGKGYKHKDKDFKRLLDKVGGARHCRSIPEQRNKSKTVHHYQCASCGIDYRRLRRMDTSKYVCGSCKGEIKKL